MDEEMVDFVREAFEGGEIDMDYEFDAPRFYDFTWPKTGREAEEAEEWFLSAGGYQPSPFLEKLLNLQKRIHPELVKNFTEPKDVEEVEVIRCIDSNNCMEAEVSVVVDDNIRDEVVFTVMFYGVSTRLELPNHMALDTPSAKPKSTGKSPPLSRSSTLMKPTASQLAEQIHRREIHSNRLLRRVAKKLRKLDEKSQNSPPPTKRHKLEAGYVRKVAEQLKHQHL
ncbi:protein TPX2-like [Pyrus communis]|uniref:protein TPX2-like n=1 Tax=Pyrus communis TaxID=23211 RepID=UPI0035C085BF